MLANEGWDTPLLIFSLRCTSKTKSILEVQNIFKTFWLWMWEVDRVIFCPVVSSIHFSYGIGLPLLINSRFDWKSSYEKCFSLAIESSIFVVNVKYKKSNGRTRINPTGGLSHAPFIEAEVLFASSPCFFTAALRQEVALSQPALSQINQWHVCASERMGRELEGGLCFVCCWHIWKWAMRASVGVTPTEMEADLRGSFS